MASIYGIQVSYLSRNVYISYIIPLRYTSTFLRENALHSLPDSEARKLDAPSSSELYQMVAEMLESSRLESGHRKFDPLNGHLYTLIDARMPIDEGQVLGTCYWEEIAQEPVKLGWEQKRKCSGKKLIGYLPSTVSVV
jgi:hypothetical protein